MSLSPRATRGHDGAFQEGLAGAPHAAVPGGPPGTAGRPSPVGEGAAHVDA